VELKIMRYLRFLTSGLTVLSLAAVAACDSGPEMAPSAARISIADDISAQRAALDWFASSAGPAAAISPDTVQSLIVDVIEVQFLAAGAAEEDAGGWQSLTLAEAVALDLMALPAESDGSIAIASGSVPVGSYSMVRLLVTGGEIVFKGPITLGAGAAGSFDGGTPYPVTVPSGDQTGLKTDVAFEVTAGEDETANAAYVVFVPGTTFQNVTVTGNGGVTLNPVIRAP
jgi:hypothetical protein